MLPGALWGQRHPCLSTPGWEPGLGGLQPVQGLPSMGSGARATRKLEDFLEVDLEHGDCQPGR